jgi:hypothetical protein
MGAILGIAGATHGANERNIEASGKSFLPDFLT